MTLNPAPFRSAYEAGAASPAEVLEFHRATFGCLRMDVEPDTGETGEPDAGAQGEPGFPADTPVAEMTAEQQAAYWRDKSQKHEKAWRGVIDKNLTPDQILAMQQKLDDHERAALSDQERAVADAKAAGRTEALTEAGQRYARILLDAQLGMRGKTDAEREALVNGANLASFVTTDGDVDIDRVNTYVAALAPASASRTPDTGQGHRGAGTALGASGVAAGAEMFAAARGKKTT